MFSVPATPFYSVPPNTHSTRWFQFLDLLTNNFLVIAILMAIKWYNFFLTVATLILSFFSKPSPLWVLILPLHSLEHYYTKCGLWDSRINTILELARNEDLKLPLQVYKISICLFMRAPGYPYTHESLRSTLQVTSVPPDITFKTFPRLPFYCTHKTLGTLIKIGFFTAKEYSIYKTAQPGGQMLLGIVMTSTTHGPLSPPF